MIKWEKKPAADQTWVNVKIYFAELYQSHTQYRKLLAKSTRFHESANNIKEKPKEAEKEENDVTMMFSMMQEQHHEQLNAIQEINTLAMKTANTTMAEMAKNMQIMMAAIPGMSSMADKENKKTNVGLARGMKPWDKPGYVKRDPKMCPDCKIVVYHKAGKCLELEINKDKRRDNWKLVL